MDLHEPSKDITISPEDIQKQVDFKPLEERPQIYYIPKSKRILLLKPMVYKVFTTTKYDKQGYQMSSESQVNLRSPCSVPSSVSKHPHPLSVSLLDSDPDYVWQWTIYVQRDL
jgi:hypothetical protein